MLKDITVWTRIADTVTGLWRWLAARPAVLFILWSLWLSVLYFGFGPLSFVSIPDNGDSNLPARLHFASSMAEDGFSYWNPMAGTGADRLAMGYSNKLDSLFFMIMPGWLVYGLLMWMQRFMASYFMYRLLRETLATGVFPSLFGAVVYSLFLQASINHQWAGFTLYDGLTLPGLPFFLWVLSRLDVNRKRHGIVCAAGLGLLTAWTGHYSYTFFLFPLVVFWFCFVTTRSLSFWLFPAVYVGVWFLGELPMLWASFLNAPLSHRASTPSLASTDFAELLSGTLGFVWAGIRDNGLALTTTLTARVFWASRNRLLSAILGFILFCITCVLICNLSRNLIRPLLGVASGFQFDRFYLLIPFLSAVSCSLSLHLIPSYWRLSLKQLNEERAVFSLRTLMCAAFILFVIGQSIQVNRSILVEMAEGSTFRNLYCNRELRAISRDAGVVPWRTATLSDRGWQGLHPGYVWAYGLESADGYMPLYSRRYHELWQRIIEPVRDSNREWYEHFLRWGSRIYLYLPSRPAEDGRPADLRRFCNVNLLSLLHVKYILSPVPLSEKTLQPVKDDDHDSRQAWMGQSRRHRLLGTLLGQSPGKPLYIYENLEVLPRIFLVEKVRVFDESSDLLDAIADADVAILRSTAHLLKSDELPSWSQNAGHHAPGNVSVSSYSADRIKLTVKAGANSILIVTNNYSPYWKAYINGSAEHIFPVNHAFQGIAIRRGAHEVVLSYEPPYALKSPQRR